MAHTYRMLPRQNRLKKETDIRHLFQKGKGVFDTVVGGKVRRNDLEHTRFAVVVGLKVHKRAYRRNRIRRRIRAVLQNQLPNIKQGYDVAVIARPEAANADFEAISTSVTSALKRMGILI